MTAAAHKPTNSDLHRCECSAMADPLSLVLPSAYGPKVPLSWERATMCGTIISYAGPIAEPTNHAGSPATYPASGVTGNTFVGHVCFGFYAVRRQGGTRCGSLRSTSPVAGSRTKCMDTVDRSSISARATSAGGRRSCVTRARPDHPLEVRSVCHRDQDAHQARFDSHQHVEQPRRGAA